MARVKQNACLVASENLDFQDLGNINASALELEAMKEKVEPSFYFGRSAVTHGLIDTCQEGYF